jgi:hypothetical protein
LDRANREDQRDIREEKKQNEKEREYFQKELSKAEEEHQIALINRYKYLISTRDRQQQRLNSSLFLSR